MGQLEVTLVLGTGAGVGRHQVTASPVVSVRSGFGNEGEVGGLRLGLTSTTGLPAPSPG